MNQKTLGIISIVLSSLFVIAIVFVVLFGVKLADANKQKTSEIATSLAAQSKELKAAFQAEREATTAKYVADEVFGSFEFSYPKVWSTNVTQEVGAATELDFMADPALIVRNKEIKGPFPALEVRVFQEKYAAKLKDIEGSNKGVKNPMVETDVTVSDIKGKKFVGTSDESKLQFAYIILPLRDKTIYIGTDDLSKYAKNYDTILKSFKISK